MSSQNASNNEEVIWKLYEKQCQEHGSKPSLEDFKDWVKSFLQGHK